MRRRLHALLVTLVVLLTITGCIYGTTPRETLDVVDRAQAAVKQAGTYKYESISVDANGNQFSPQTGEVAIGGGWKIKSDSGDLTYIDASGRYHRQDAPGFWSTFDLPEGFEPDPMTKFLKTPVTDWTLLGMEPIGGRNTYAIKRVYTHYNAERYETTWIDAETFLPVKTVDLDPKPANVSRETTYADFGAPVDVAVPQNGLAPTPTPVPPPSPSDTPMQVADGFMQAVTNGHLAEVAQYFSPNRQPKGWDDAFSRNAPGARAYGCRGVDYQTVEQQIDSAGTTVAVNFLFATPCATMPSGEATDTVGVELENAAGRWYVLEAGVGLAY